MSTEQWPTLIGTLGGAAIGALAAYANQAAQWRRQRAVRWDESRRESYAHFLGIANAYFLALMDLRWSLLNDPAQVEKAGSQAHEFRAKSRMIKAELDIVAGRETRQAAEKLAAHLSAINQDLYDAQREGTAKALPTWLQHEELYKPIAERFVIAVNQELV